jgi:hypothetical protein
MRERDVSTLPLSLSLILQKHGKVAKLSLFCSDFKKKAEMKKSLRQSSGKVGKDVVKLKSPIYSWDQVIIHHHQIAISSKLQYRPSRHPH